MAGHAKYFLPVLYIFIIAGNSHSALKLNAVLAFPYRCLFPYMMFLADTSPADNTDTYGITIFSIFSAFIAFHGDHSVQNTVFLNVS